MAQEMLMSLGPFFLVVIAFPSSLFQFLLILTLGAVTRWQWMAVLPAVAEVSAEAIITTPSFCPSFILFSSSVWCSHPLAPAFHPVSSHLQPQRWVLTNPSLVVVLPSMLSEDPVNVDLMAPFCFLTIGVSDYVRGHCFYHCFCHCFCHCFALFCSKTSSKNK